VQSKIPRHISGETVRKILVNKFGFYVKRQRGSHCTLAKNLNTLVIGTVVPMHDEIRIGTLKNILELAKISEDDFFKYL
jgi:predicted RNA binding protein YcfA (HicA-like mRNA interferase family)